MLVLSRKVGESIVIAGNIEVVVTERKGDIVRLGVIAPKEVSVHRKEVQEKIHDQSKPIYAGIVHDNGKEIDRWMSGDHSAVLRWCERQERLRRGVTHICCVKERT